MVAIYREKLTNVEIQDGSTTGNTVMIQAKNGIARLMLFSVIYLMCCLPILFISQDMVSDPISISFVHMVIPAIVGAFMLMGGPYDYLANKIKIE